MNENEDPNCIIKEFNKHNVVIIKEEPNKYWFKASDIGKILELSNINMSVQNYTEKEKGLRKVYGSGGMQSTLFLSSHGIYRLLYSSKKEVAKNFREWVGDILDDIVFNQSKELKKQLDEKEKQIQTQNDVIKLLENKPETEGKNSRIPGYLYLLKDDSKIGHYKIGLTVNIKDREMSLNVGSSTKTLKIIHEFPTNDHIFSERIVHQSLIQYRIKNRNEWFYFPFENDLEYAIKIIQKCILFVKNIDDTDEKEIDFKSIARPVEIKSISTQTISESLPVNLEKDINFEVSSFTRFIKENCVIDLLQEVSVSELVFQYKVWNLFSIKGNDYKDFQKYIEKKFKVKRIYDEKVGNNVSYAIGISLNPEFYNFNFNEPLNEFEMYLQQCCIKNPSARTEKTSIKESFTKFMLENNKDFILTNKIELNLVKYLDKCFYRHLFNKTNEKSYTSYSGWYGISVKDNADFRYITVSEKRKKPISKIDKEGNIIGHWDSQVTLANILNKSPQTIKRWIEENVKDLDGNYYIYDGEKN